MRDLAGRVAFITGPGSGIGPWLARAWRKEEEGGPHGHPRAAGADRGSLHFVRLDVTGWSRAADAVSLCGMADLQNQPQELFPQPFSGRTPDDESVCHMRCSTEHLLPETRSWHAPSSIDVAATEHSAAAGGVGQR